MNVSLTPELEQYVKEKVSSGLYYSASEVIREGLRLLKEREQLQQIRLQELRQDIQAGLDSGEPTPSICRRLKTKRGGAVIRGNRSNGDRC
uniref:Type II toxin-antitoxin system ParD family antitoxin n=1 Tax=Desertifilum tharense IPPAS B-1220 TaxID=1781255 RepID=A0ACD5GPT0_9CYAN